MKFYQLEHLAEPTLFSNSDALAVRIETAMAEFLAHIAQIDERKAYVGQGYHSMFAFCLARWRLSEDEAARRIHAARAARRFPAIFEALAAGRLHLTAVSLLAPHLTEANAGELIAAATHKSRAEIERLLASRFPRPDLPTCIRPIVSSAVAPAMPEHGPGHVAAPAPEHGPGHVAAPMPEHGPGHVAAPTPEHGPGHAAAPAPEHGPGHVAGQTPLPAPPPVPTPRPRITPIAPRRYVLTVTIDESTQSKLVEAQELLSHIIAPGDIAAVLDRALDLLVAQLRKRKFAGTSKPRAERATVDAPADPRTIPAHVKRIVWARDGGQCTFRSPTGHRCEARSRLEFDHRVEVARGGEASVSNIRLRCRAHNQYEAEGTFGAGFMEARRAARRRRESRPVPRMGDPGRLAARGSRAALPTAPTRTTRDPRAAIPRPPCRPALRRWRSRT